MSILSTTLKSQWPFSPQSIAGLSLWLDAADTSSMTFSSGTTINIWRDKSGLGNNATATGSPTLAQNSINGVQAVTGAVGTYFTGALSFSGTSFTCFAVATTNYGLPNFSSSGDQRLVSLANGGNVDYNSTGGVIPLFNQYSTSNIATYNNALGNVASNAIVRNTPFMAATQYNGTIASLWFNGSAGSFSSSSTNSFTVTKYGIGNQANPTIEYWSGFIGEILFFNTAISISDRQQVEGYLAQKWGLQTSLPATHPYYAITSIPTVPAPTAVSSPTAISNLALWLDGQDPAGTGTPPSNGATVSTWVDKSGLVRNGTASGTPVYTTNSINGFPSIYLNTGPYFTGSISFSSYELTCFAVASTSVTLPNNRSPPSDQRLISLANGGNEDYTSTGGVIPLFNQNTFSNIATYNNALGNVASNTMSTGVPFLAVSQFNGMNASIWVNGSVGNVISSSISSNKFTVTKYGIGQQANAPRQEYWYGYIGEIIIYTSALSDYDRRRVELYLENKWGITQIASASYSTPKTISGLSLWLDGADPAGTGTPPSNGATITSWVDKSLSGNSATPTGTITATTMNGLTAINFSGSAYLTSPFTSGAASPFTIFVVETQANTSGGPIYTTNTSTTVNGLFLNYGGTDYLDIGNALVSRASSININQTYILSIVSTSVNGGTATLYTNGSPFFSGTTNGNFSWTTLLIGKRNAGGAQETFAGKMAEFIVYNSALTTTQRQSIEAYLSAKWGVTLTRNTQYLQLYKRPVFQRTFSPVDISGCALWLDAADLTSIIGTSPVTAWKDKSGNGADATNTGTTITISTLNGLPAINYDGSSYLTAPITSGVADPFSMFFIFSQAAYGAPVYSTSTSTDGNALFLNYGGATDLLEGNGSWISRSSTISNNQTYLLSIVSTSVNNGTITLYVNGASYLSGTTIGAFTWTSFLIGKRTIPGWNETLSGKFGEIMVFKSALSSSQRQQVESYLAWKWGLVSSLPTSPVHPGKTLPTFSITFSPKSVSGLQMWLDAADTSTVIGTSPVTQWNDKSGNNYNAYATTTGNNLSLSTINGVQAINYGGNSYLIGLLTSGAASPFSIFIIFSQSSTVGPVFTTSTTTDASGLFLNYGGSSTGGNTDFLSIGSQWATHGSSTINSNTPYLLSIVSTSVSGGTITLYVNGTSYMSGTTTGNFSWTTLLIGRRSYGGNNENFAGKFGEFIIFNSAVSTSQRQQVEGYLAWKWGLVGNLPSTHAYKKISP